MCAFSIDTDGPAALDSDSAPWKRLKTLRVDSQLKTWRLANADRRTIYRSKISTQKFKRHTMHPIFVKSTVPRRSSCIHFKTPDGHRVHMETVNSHHLRTWRTHSENPAKLSKLSSTLLLLHSVVFPRTVVHTHMPKSIPPNNQIRICQTDFLT